MYWWLLLPLAVSAAVVFWAGARVHGRKPWGWAVVGAVSCLAGYWLGAHILQKLLEHPPQWLGELPLSESMLKFRSLCLTAGALFSWYVYHVFLAERAMRRSVALAIAALIVVVVGWCERTPSVSDFDPQRHAAFKDTWEKRIHISYWEKWGSFEAEACQKMVDVFNESQNGIFCHYIRTSQVDRKSMLAVVGGEPPDVVGLWSTNVRPFAEAEALLPLDDRMAAAGLTDELYVTNYLLLGRHKGRTYALPTTPSTIALFYNKEHYGRKAADLRAAGCDPNRPPRTIAELDRYADALSEFQPDGAPKIMGFMPVEPGWFHEAWPYYFGGSLWDEKTGVLTPDSKPVIRAFEWIKSYANRYGRENLTRFHQGFGNFDSPQNAFIDGKVSMVLQGVWFPSFIDRHRPHLDYDVVPFPCAEGVPGPRSLMDEDVIAIPRGCKHPGAAWKFIHWVQTKGLPVICRLQGKHLPIKLPPEQAETFRKAHPNPFLRVFDDLARAPQSFILPRSVVWREYRDEYRRAFDHVWHWPIPEEKLQGLTGAAREEKKQALCSEEIVRTLGGIRRRMERRVAQKLHRLGMRKERAGR